MCGVSVMRYWICCTCQSKAVTGIGRRVARPKLPVGMFEMEKHVP